MLWAASYFREAIELEPNWGRVYAELAWALMRQSTDWSADDLESLYCKALELEPDYFWVCIYLANLQWQLRRINKARYWYRTQLKNFPDSATSHWVYGDFLAGAGADTVTAEHHLQHAVKIDPESATAYYALGKALHRWERYRDAEPQPKRALELGDDRAASLLSNAMP